MLKKISRFAMYPLLLLCTIGCAPTITVVHQDPTTEKVLVKIDNREVDTLEFGEKYSKNVSRGMHYLQAIPEGQDHCPWAEDGKGWTVWVDEGSVLTLFPLPTTSTQNAPAAARKARELPSPYDETEAVSREQPANSDDQ